MSLDLFCTTVIRHAPVSAGGEVLRLEWPLGRVLARRPVIPQSPSIDDPNPRGNSRGGRGLAICDDMLIVASYHSLEICDWNLQKRSVFSDGNFVGIHEISLRDERLFVACTAINAAAQLPLDMIRQVTIRMEPEDKKRLRYWWPTESEAICHALRIPLTSYEAKEADNRLRYLDFHNRGKSGHLHLNAIDADTRGTYALLNKPGAILQLDPLRIVLHHPLLEGAHNLRVHEPGRAYVVSTRAGALVECDLRLGTVKPLLNLNDTPFARAVIAGSRPSLWYRFRRSPAVEDQSAKPLFWRGLAMNSEFLFVGTSPAAILAFDRRNFSYCGAVVLSRNVREIVHGLVVAEPSMRDSSSGPFIGPPRAG